MLKDYQFNLKELRDFTHKYKILISENIFLRTLKKFGYCLHILVPYFILSPHWQSWHEDNPKSYILYFPPTNTDIRYPINHLKKSSEYNADLYVFLLLLFLHTSL